MLVNLTQRAQLNCLPKPYLFCLRVAWRDESVYGVRSDSKKPKFRISTASENILQNITDLRKMDFSLLFLALSYVSFRNHFKGPS